MDDLHIIALGSVLGKLNNVRGDLEAGVEWFVALRDCYNKGAVTPMGHSVPWLDFLCRTAQRYLGVTSTIEKKNLKFLLSYGKRKGHSFLTEHSRLSPVPLFGLLDGMLLATCSTDFTRTLDSKEVLVDRLRDLARRCGFEFREGVIAYYNSYGNIEVATAVPGGVFPYNDRDRSVHFRWTSENSSRRRNIAHSNEVYLPIRDTDVTIDEYDHDGQLVPALSWHNCPSEIRNLPNLPFQCIFVAGDTKKAALFSTRGFGPAKRLGFTGSVSALNPTYRELSEFFRSSRVIPSRLRQIIDSKDFTGGYAIQPSIDALVYATTVYDKLPGVTISIRVVHRTLHRTVWGQRYLSSRHLPKEMSDSIRRVLDFTIITWFETGSVDLEISELYPVMAMASGNSIFVAKALLQSPSNIDSGSITRLLGNLGRPGVVMLVPPQAPRVRPIDPGAWRLLNHFDFDGNLESSFNDTSLHLSFTEYELPVMVSVGAVDAEVTMLETLVSVYDRDQWVADIDVLNALEEAFICSSGSGCRGEGPYDSSRRVDGAAIFMRDNSTKQLISIDCWEELLDPPHGIGQSCVGMVKAGNHWNARLATMCVSVQKGLRTQVLPNEKPLCFHCNEGLENMVNTTDIFII